MILTPLRQATDQQKVVPTGSRSRKTEQISSPAASSSPHVLRDGRQAQCPKIMFTGVIADNAEKVTGFTIYNV